MKKFSLLSLQRSWGVLNKGYHQVRLKDTLTAFFLRKTTDGILLPLETQQNFSEILFLVSLNVKVRKKK